MNKSFSLHFAKTDYINDAGNEHKFCPYKTAVFLVNQCVPTNIKQQNKTLSIVAT